MRYLTAATMKCNYLIVHDVVLVLPGKKLKQCIYYGGRNKTSCEVLKSCPDRNPKQYKCIQSIRERDIC